MAGQKYAADYGSLLSEIKSRVREAQYAALRAVNKELVGLYWDIGRLIVDRQRSEGWGRSVVKRLAADLQAEFPGVAGFSAANLWRMKLFYETYAGDSKLAPMVREIAWSHNILVFERCGDRQEREFYIRMTRKWGWSKSALAANIEAGTYGKYLRNQTNFDAALSERDRGRAKLAVKDEYVFDFLELGEEHSEKQLETALIAKVNRFLIEMGGAFAFLGSQFRLEVEGLDEPPPAAGGGP
jgi:predicted nuclease of restriction endonuclease-like (RecB) superfamily